MSATSVLRKIGFSKPEIVELTRRRENDYYCMPTLLDGRETIERAAAKLQTLTGQTRQKTRLKRLISTARRVLIHHDGLQHAWAQRASTGRVPREDALKHVSERIISERRLSTSAGWDGGHVMDVQGSCWVYQNEYWYHYSNRAGDRRVGASYLMGVERQPDGRLQTWGVRIPSHITRVSEAQAYVEPAAVRNARAEGKKVIRQGEVYLVEARTNDWGGLPRTHVLTDEPDGSIILSHGQHERVILPAGSRWRVHLQKSVEGRVHD